MWISRQVLNEIVLRELENQIKYNKEMREKFEALQSSTGLILKYLKLHLVEIPNSKQLLNDKDYKKYKQDH